MYAADATVTGDPTLLRRDLSLQLRRFFAGVRGTGARPATSARACASTTCRTRRSTHAMNVDSAEYANIVLTFTRFYDQARRAGMPALPASARACHARVGHARDRRLLDARRLHELGLRARLRALAPGEEARARAAGADRPRVAPRRCSPARSGAAGRRRCSTAASSFYDRLAARAPGGLPDPVLFDVTQVPQGRGQRALAAARDRGQRRPRASTPASAARPAPSRRRCTPTTPTSAAWP